MVLMARQKEAHTPGGSEGEPQPDGGGEGLTHKGSVTGPPGVGPRLVVHHVPALDCFCFLVPLMRLI